MEKLIITVAPVGAETTRQQNPALPLTPAEIAEDVHSCWKEGASIVHLHARRPDGTPTQDPEVYREIISLIRQKSDIIVQVSTGGAVGMGRLERAAPVMLRPEMATLTAGTCNFGKDIFVNSPDDIEYFAETIRDNGVTPEIEIFEPGMISTAEFLMNKGLVPQCAHFDFVLGVPGAMSATPKNLVFLSGSLPGDCTWSVAGIGRHELPMAAMAIIMGGHVRVGFEDNIFYSKGVLAESNAQLVRRVARLAAELGRKIASPAETRALLRIK
jgi:3-keto-5-aminohexanoate cleavage enzyme